MTNTPTGAPGTAPQATAPTSEKDRAEKKEPKAAKPKKEKVKKDPAAARPRLPKFPDEHIITILKPNSKTRGANERFNRYETGMTVRAYLNRMKEELGRTDGMTMADIRWDHDHQFINVGPTVVDVPPPPPPAPAKEPAKAATTSPAA